MPLTRHRPAQLPALVAQRAEALGDAASDLHNRKGLPYLITWHSLFSKYGQMAICT